MTSLGMSRVWFPLNPRPITFMKPFYSPITPAPRSGLDYILRQEQSPLLTHISANLIPPLPSAAAGVLTTDLYAL